MLKSIEQIPFLGEIKRKWRSPIYTLLFMFKDYDGPHTYGRCSGPDICGRYWEVSADSTKLFPSAVMRISCSSWLVYKLWCSTGEVQWTCEHMIVQWISALTLQNIRHLAHVRRRAWIPPQTPRPTFAHVAELNLWTQAGPPVENVESFQACLHCREWLSFN